MMKRKHGFSLLEVLVAFSLMTGTSLILFKQQWYIQKIVLQLFAEANALIILDNLSECDE